MVRRLQGGLSLVAVAVLLGWAAPAAAAPAPAPVATVLVPVPSGAALPPGRYQVVIRGNGRAVTATGSVLPAATPSAPAPQESTDGGGVWIGLLGALLVAMIVAGGFLVVRGPVHRRREFERLAAKVEAEEYAEAVAGLTRIESGLPPSLRTEARFLCGYGLYQLGDLDEAEHRLAALHREEPEHAEVAYLLAYLRVQRRDFDGAQPVLATLEKQGALDVGQARRLYGVVQFQRAGRAVAEGRIDAAVALFEDVERLGDFRDRVPADLRNRHVALGTRALLDRDTAAARKQFEELRDAGGSDDHQASALLGLALTAWAENQPGTGRQVHKLLSECLRWLEPDQPTTRRWPGPPRDSVTDEITRIRRSAAEPEAGRDRTRMLADIHLLRGCALVRVFAEEDSPPGSTRQLLGGTAERLAGALSGGRELADPYLVVGLLRHHLATGPAERLEALAELKAAQALGARDPLLLEILQRHEQQDRRRSAVWSGRTVPYGRVPTLDDVSAAAGGTESSPTVAELSERADLLVARLHALGDGGATSALVDRLTRESAELVSRARAIESTEAELLALVGDRLLAGDLDEEGSIP